jgi:hypothetical protein
LESAVLGNWLRKKNNNFARSMVSVCLSTISTRNLANAETTGFCGIAAAELALCVAKGSIRRIENEQDRLLTALFGVVYSNHFASLIEGVAVEASHLAAELIIGNEYFYKESQQLISVYTHLSFNDPIAIDTIRGGCIKWLKDPSLLNLQAMSRDFGNMHNRIVDEPKISILAHTCFSDSTGLHDEFTELR